MDNISIDIETLGTDDRSIVLSIGAVYFNKTGIGQSFYRVLDIARQIELGRVINEESLQWWARQSEEAKAILNEKGDPVQDVLLAFNEFASIFGTDVKVWGNGATFDNVIVSTLYKDMGMERPWRFTNDRCYRTLKNILHPHGNLPTANRLPNRSTRAC